MTQGSDRISEDELKELFDCEALDALNTGTPRNNNSTVTRVHSSVI